MLMVRVLFKLSILLLCSLSLSAKSGVSQSHLVSLTPAPSATDVSSDTAIKVQFDLPIEPESIDQSTIVLKHNTGFAVNGSIGIAAANTLHFTPQEELKGGGYSVTVQSVELQSKQKQISKPSTFLERLVHWICSIFYDDISKCPLCKYFCKMEPVKISTDPIEYTFSVKSEPKITEIRLFVPLTELPKGDGTSARATAVYSDNEERDVSEEAEWIVSDPSVLTVDDNGTVTALKDGNVTLQAKYEETLSNPVNINIYWEVDGHRLPPEPDPKVNNATLLGVDVNNNGVRDDVERWIYEEYKDKHPIHIDIAMQIAKASQEILKNPNMSVSKAKLLHKAEVNGLICESYFSIYAKYFNKKILVKTDIGTGYLEDLYFNTEDRKQIYKKYSSLLSGDSYSTPPADENMTSYCDFNASKYTE